MPELAIDDVTYAKLRFLANAAYAALSGADTGATYTSDAGTFGPGATPKLLIGFLKHSLSVLDIAPAHRELLLHINEALAEIERAASPDRSA